MRFSSKDPHEGGGPRPPRGVSGAQNAEGRVSAALEPHDTRVYLPRTMFGAIARYVSRHHIALLALFVALGGSAAAAAFINGKSIKPGSIPENRLAPQAVASLK